jgi:hypothetical protein
MKSWQQKQKDRIKELEEDIRELVLHPESKRSEHIRNMVFLNEPCPKQFLPLLKILKIKENKLCGCQ